MCKSISTWQGDCPTSSSRNWIPFSLSGPRGEDLQSHSSIRAKTKVSAGCGTKYSVQTNRFLQLGSEKQLSPKSERLYPIQGMCYLGTCPMSLPTADKYYQMADKSKMAVPVSTLITAVMEGESEVSFFIDFKVAGLLPNPAIPLPNPALGYQIPHKLPNAALLPNPAVPLPNPALSYQITLLLCFLKLLKPRVSSSFMLNITILCNLLRFYPFVMPIRNGFKGLRLPYPTLHVKKYR